MVKAYERVLDRIPFVRGLYVATKQLMEQVLSTRSDRFRRAVLIEYPRKGIYSIGFVTGRAEGTHQRATPGEPCASTAPKCANKGVGGTSRRRFNSFR